MAELNQLKPAIKLNEPIKPEDLQKVIGAATTATTQPVQSFGLDEEGGEFLKMASFGYSATGKTLAIAGLVLAGERVFVLTTDLGGNGLASVRSHLKNAGRADLLKNIRFVDLRTYAQVSAFLEAPHKIVPTIWDFDPTVLAWDGGSFFQTVLLDDEILSSDAVAKDGVSKIELRNKGLFALETDWNAIRRGTVRALNEFLTLHHPNGRLLDKYMTFVESEPPKDEKGNLILNAPTSPLLYTAAKNLAKCGFDIVFNTVAHTPLGRDAKTEYKYRFAVDKAWGKNRGFDLKNEEPADMEVLWKRLKGRQ